MVLKRSGNMALSKAVGLPLRDFCVVIPGGEAVMIRFPESREITKNELYNR
jgi:hypothetical protein